MNITDLDQRLQRLDTLLRETHRKAAAVDAVVAERRQRASAIGKQVSEAKHRLKLQPEVQGFMVALQQRVHQRGVGLYEKLLTALVQDVLPENPHPVSLELSTDKGLPALTIQLGRGDTAQNIFEDTGGSLTNVVSSGLRFVALARSPLRKFMVLDEPDCWIEPHRIPRFADILASMADEVQVQAILISHHNDASFIAIRDRMRLEKDSGGLIRVRTDKKPEWASDTQPGIRSIRLERFMSHRDTTLELGPGINVLSGPNHIGKSAVVNALRVFAYHEGADRLIMHGCDDYIITLTLENGKVLTCRRNRKGARKTIYTYFEPGMDKPREEPAGKTEPPDFVRAALNIQRLNDLDIQLSHQKMPVFLLHESKTKQAMLLSAGLEADHVRQMLERYKKWSTMDLATVRNGEAELTSLSAALNAWDEKFSGKTVAEQGLTLDRQLSELREQLLKLTSMNSLATRMSRHEKVRVAKIELPAFEVPTVTPIDPMRKLGAHWGRAVKLKGIALPGAAPEVPALKPLEPMMKIGKSWTKFSKRFKALKDAAQKVEAVTTPILDTPPSITVGPMIALHTQWKAKAAALAKHMQDLNAAHVEQAAAEKERDVILAETGGVCPLCMQGWPHGHKKNESDEREAA